MGAFVFGLPLAVMGIIAAIGVGGILLLVGIIFGIISVWYVLYAIIKGMTEKEELVEKRDYTIDRIKEAK